MVRLYVSFLGLVGIIGQITSAIQLLDYHESCSLRDLGKSQCNPDLGLICNGKQCDCQKVQSQTVFEEASQACVIPVGEYCFSERLTTRKLERPCAANSTCKTVDPFLVSGKSIPQPLIQAINSRSHFYISHGIEKCVCDEGFIQSGTGCILALQHDDKCSKTSTRCDITAGLVCKDGKCTCKEPTHYNSHNKACEAKVGVACHPGTLCETNSVCSSTLDHIRYITDIHNIIFRRYSSVLAPGTPPARGKKNKSKKRTTVLDTCVCIPGYSQNSDGKCVGSFHVPCSKDSPCNSEMFLSCIDGICQCEKGSKEFFSEIDGKGACRLLVGETCKSDDGPHCVKNAECSDSKCKCKTGYSAGVEEETCFLTHDSECVAPNPYSNHSHEHEACNFFKGLACKDGKCGCFDKSHTWSKDLEMCVADEGQRCGEISITEMGIGAESHRNHDSLYPPLHALHEETRTIDGYHFQNSYYIGCHKGQKCMIDIHDVHELHICHKIKD